MKKLVFMFVAFAAISFASCGNKTAATDAAADTDTVVAVVPADSDSVKANPTDSDSVKVQPTAEPNA